jgi:arylsulfatase A-like enzyme
VALFAVLVAAGLSAGAEAASRAAPPNVVYFLVDTLRADRVGAYGCPRDTSPSVDALASRGTLFELAIAQANLTVVSVSSIFTSLYPLSHGVLDASHGLGEGPPTLAEIFGANGYATGAFTAGGHMGPSFKLDRGFQTYRSMTYPGSFRVTVPQAVDWLAQLGPAPFFTVIHTYDVHAPYRVPLGFQELHDPGYRGLVDTLPFSIFRFLYHVTGDSYDACGHGWLPATVCDGCGVESLTRGLLPPFEPRAATPQPGAETGAELPLGPGGLPYRLPPLERRLSPEDARHLVAHYDGALTYSDLWIGLFLEELERRGLRDNTLFVLSGDHGESLGEHGRYDHGYHPFDVNLHVPLILSGPGVPAGKRVTGPVELIDVAPTLLELCGLTACRTHQGRSLIPEMRPPQGGPPPPERDAFSVTQNVASLRTSRWHYLSKRPGRTEPEGRKELYDLLHDPGETESVLSRYPEEASVLERRLLERIEAALPKSRPRQGPLRPEDAGFLRSFGYW